MAPTVKTYLLLLLIVLVSVFIPFLIHVLLTRILRLFVKPAERQKGPLWSTGIGFGLLLVILSVWIMINGIPETARNCWTAIYFIGVYLLFAYVYFHFFNMSETARRIRILIESSHSPTVNIADVGSVYTLRQMVTIRISRLIALGELNENGNRYITGRGLLLIPAVIISFFHNLLFPPESPPGDLP